MTYLLRFQPDSSDGIGKWSDYNGPWYLVRLGEQWPNDPRNRLIHETTRDPNKGRQFASEEEARACHAEAGSPKGWEVVPA